MAKLRITPRTTSAITTPRTVRGFRFAGPGSGIGPGVPLLSDVTITTSTAAVPSREAAAPRERPHCGPTGTGDLGQTGPPSRSLREAPYLVIESAVARADLIVGTRRSSIDGLGFGACKKGGKLSRRLASVG
jgi:hypothetical protein